MASGSDRSPSHEHQQPFDPWAEAARRAAARVDAETANWNLVEAGPPQGGPARVPPAPRAAAPPAIPSAPTRRPPPFLQSVPVESPPEVVAPTSWTCVVAEPKEEPGSSSTSFVSALPLPEDLTIFTLPPKTDPAPCPQTLNIILESPAESQQTPQLPPTPPLQPEEKAREGVDAARATTPKLEFEGLDEQPQRPGEFRCFQCGDKGASFMVEVESTTTNWNHALSTIPEAWLKWAPLPPEDSITASFCRRCSRKHDHERSALLRVIEDRETELREQEDLEEALRRSVTEVDPPVLERVEFGFDAAGFDCRELEEALRRSCEEAKAQEFDHLVQLVDDVDEASGLAAAEPAAVGPAAAAPVVGPQPAEPTEPTEPTEPASECRASGFDPDPGVRDDTTAVVGARVESWPAAG